MKKICFLGDSITDMNRNKTCSNIPSSYGFSHVFFSEGYLSTNYPNEYSLINKGVSGSRIIDVYERIKSDLWNELPEYATILIGINDIWHGIDLDNGIELDRFIKIFEMIIDETKEKSPRTKFIVIEPFFVPGKETSLHLDEFKKIYLYSSEIKKLCDNKNIPFITIQEKISCLSKKNGSNHYLYDGIHPSVAGSKLISDEWLKVFLKLENK